MRKSSVLEHYWLALTITGLVFIALLFTSGISAWWPVAVLALIEVTFSFDNAVLNSEVLGRMSKRWRLVFLTVGIAIAVFGVRLILPLLLVATTTGEGIGHVLGLALHHPDEYAQHLHEGYPVIAAFGGIFLLMIGLRFLAEARDTKWIHVVEHNISRHDRPWLIPIAGAGVAIAVIATVVRPHDPRVVTAALMGLLTFLIIKGISVVLERSQGGSGSKHHNWVNFLYLELLDASFSFDGVVAAFAITKDVLLIAAGLGIGALYVRSITVHLLERNTLNDYRYLIHGAHYAIIALGFVMIASMRVELPEWFTGSLGIGIIVWALWNSIQHNRRDIAALGDGA